MTGKYKKSFIILFLLLFSACRVKTTNETSFILKEERIQISQNSSIDYLSYIEGNNESIQFTPIDTSKRGTYNVVYTQNNQQHTLIVDVVRMYEHHIFNPQDVDPEIISNPNEITALVNKTHQIPEDYIPNDLVEVIDSHQKLRKEAALAYNEFYQAAKQKGITCYAISGYRTNEMQTLYWKRQVAINGEEYASQYSAYPLRSEHQLGLAIDVSYQLTGDRLTCKVASSEIGKFIISDGYKYGFILRYPEDKIAITNYGYEPWHMRYVGKELAKKLYESQMTLEEYVKENHV